MKTSAFLLFGVLAIGPTVQAGTVSLLADGIIDQAWNAGYPFVDPGDSFRLSISYSDGWADTDPSANFGSYRPDDLSVTLEILGEGVAFRSIGGSVSVSLDPSEFPAFTIISTLQDGNPLVVVFRDDDRSSILDDSLPINFGIITDYDSVGFSVIHFPVMWPGNPPNPIDGSISRISVPEPHTVALAAVGLMALLRLRRGRQ